MGLHVAPGNHRGGALQESLTSLWRARPRLGRDPTRLHSSDPAPVGKHCLRQPFFLPTSLHLFGPGHQECPLLNRHQRAPWARMLCPDVDGARAKLTFGGGPSPPPGASGERGAWLWCLREARPWKKGCVKAQPGALINGVSACRASTPAGFSGHGPRTRASVAGLSGPCDGTEKRC